VTDTIAATIDDYVTIAARLANDPAERASLSARIRDSQHKVYRDRACISALEDFLDRAARSPAAANAVSAGPPAA
jgi:predicted O-linked N-acetylglucosamine transferase (SPINDLY family)